MSTAIKGALARGYVAVMPDVVLTTSRAVIDGTVRPASIHVHNGKIVAVTAPGEVPEGVSHVVTDAVVLPGIVDTHVHINEPGRTHWEGFDTATRAAAAGGVTTLVDMPLNSIPPTTSVAGLAAKRAAAEGKVWVDVGFCGGLVPDSVPALRGMREAGALAFKCFLAPSGVDEFPHVLPSDLARGMAELGSIGAPLLIHAELPGPLDAAARHAASLDPHSYAAWLDSRPQAAEVEAIELAFALSRKHAARAHVVHLSAADALPILARAQREDVPLTAETCPHYLSFAAERILDGATAFKCAPPIREEANRALLWQALGQGLLSQVVTDHSPAEPGIKHVDDGDFVAAWGGIASLQLGLRATWTEASARSFDLPRLVEWMCAAPARLVGLAHRKGRIAPGMDADLVLFDPDAVEAVDPARLFHRHPITPYAGLPLRGRVRETWLAGRRIYADGRHVDRPAGTLLRAEG